MMINNDISATAFNTAGPLPDFFAKILNRRSLDELRRGVSERELKYLEKALKAVRIQTVHSGDKNFRYKISRLTSSSAELTTFMDEAGNEVTISDYFLKQYNKRLNYPFLPSVVLGESNYLPMEVCEVVPGQRLTRKMNESKPLK